MIKWINILFAACFFQSVTAQEWTCYLNDEKAQPRERLVDFKHIELDIEIMPYQHLVKGRATFDIEPLAIPTDSIWLDAPNISVLGVSSDQNDSIAFTQNSEGIAIKLESPIQPGGMFKLHVDYSAHPQKGLYFVGWKDSADVRQIWTQGQGIDNRHWFPHFDYMAEKQTTELIVKFPKGYPLLSNGKLVSKKVEDNKTTWHYKMEKPHSSYLVMLAAGTYESDTITNARGLEISQWYYKGQEDMVPYTYKGTKEMTEVITDFMGVDYPWERYSMVPTRNYLYGGMENTTATIFAETFVCDSLQYQDKNFVYVNAHEFAHQWFGDLVTSVSPEAHWIHEGFATFFHHYWLGEFFGKDEYYKQLDIYRRASFAASKKNIRPISHSGAGSARHYFKASIVIEMLRQELGESAFRTTLTEFLKRYEHKTVSSEDFLRTVYDVTGKPMNWFWDQWVYRGGEPMVRAELTKKWGKSHLILEQTQPDSFGTYRLPMNVKFAVDGSDREIELDFNARKDTVELPFNVRDVDYFILDNAHKLLIQEDKQQSDEQWLNQMLNDDHPMAVVEAMRNLELADYDNELKKLFEKSESEFVKIKLISMISENQELVDDLLKSVKEESVEVRKAYVENCKVTDVGFLETQLIATSYELRREALKQIIEADRANAETYMRITEDLKTDHQFLYRMDWLHLAHSVEYITEEDFVGEMEKYSGPGYDFVTRNRALMILRAKKIQSEKVIDNAMDAAQSFNRSLRSSGCQYLKALDEDTRKELLQKVMLSSNSLKIKRLERCLK
ncbi:M1 family metallopeptidase [Salibacter sp.]|uniref:M1 family metallopeptidase n=1 Tax=Salibacter sp. TaxID=2010995 RepID=UPI0028708849|nr:M1 family metallopeptidase [Salibacter sp.]MDR9487904.1 M1 family metallopeptidase [Salibacter sp.]